MLGISPFSNGRYEGSNLLENRINSRDNVRLELVHKADVLLSYGGDGTLIQAVHQAYETDPYFSAKVVGVNSGNVGFLTSFPANKLDYALDKIPELVDKEDRIDERSCISCFINGSERLFALNELLVSTRKSKRMINLSVFVDGDEVFDFRGDGLIISTATGSTAHNLSAGGPVITPGSGSLCITPLAAYSLSVRPVVVDENKEIKVVVKNSDDIDWSIVSDGQFDTRTYNEFSVKFSRSIDLFRPKESFYSLINNKLNWSN